MSQPHHPPGHKPAARIDAVIVPAGYATAADPYTALVQLATEFAPLLGVARFHRKTLADHRDFCPRDVSDTLLYPVGHPREGQPRYDWVERSERDGVLYGTRKADA